MKQITLENADQFLKSSGVKAQVFYSTWLGGYTTDLRLMQVPLDDHMVHRGDGVFEAFRFTKGNFYLLEAHLNRLERSMKIVGISAPSSSEEIKKTLNKLIEVSGPGEWLIRLFVSRGPGGFTTNPYESVGPQLYIAITPFVPVSEEKYKVGVSVGFTEISVKEGLWSQVKSCNYLPNVMMKKEAVDRKLDFVIGLDSQGFATESSTENLAWINERGVLCHPPFENCLRGTTLVRLFELVNKKNVMKTSVENCSRQSLEAAQGAFMVGTTLNVLPVASLGEKKYSESVWWKTLNDLILQDQSRG